MPYHHRVTSLLYMPNLSYRKLERKALEFDVVSLRATTSNQSCNSHRLHLIVWKSGRYLSELFPVSDDSFLYGYVLLCSRVLPNLTSNS